MVFLESQTSCWASNETTEKMWPLSLCQVIFCGMSLVPEQSCGFFAPRFVCFHNLNWRAFPIFPLTNESKKMRYALGDVWRLRKRVCTSLQMPPLFLFSHVGLLHFVSKLFVRRRKFFVHQGMPSLYFVKWLLCQRYAFFSSLFPLFCRPVTSYCLYYTTFLLKCGSMVVGLITHHLTFAIFVSLGVVIAPNSLFFYSSLLIFGDVTP